jgi:phosphatidylglycerol:prolipoprotein diacylglycerol transferase
VPPGYRRVAGGLRLAPCDVLPALRFVLGGTQLVLSLHGLAIVLGAVAGGGLALRRAPQPGPVLVALASVAVASLAGAHGLFVLVHGGRGTLWTGGLASTGGVAAGFGATWVVAGATRCRTCELLDAIVPAGLLALAIGRVGCFLAGCCYGRPTALPWGVVFPELGPPARHPLQLYSALGDALLLLALPRRARVPGSVARRGCIGFGCLRTALETLRDPATTDVLPGCPFTLPQAAALLLVAAAAALRPREPSIYASPRRSLAHGR